jgi:hypothetical protein
MAMGSKNGRTPAMFDTLAVFQLAMFWLKAVAVRNMVVMVVALAMFHAPMFALKAVALANMLRKVDTLAVFHAPMLPLKAGAPWNMFAILGTLAVFHLLISALNVGLLLNTDAMLLTAAVFQSAIGPPYVVVAAAGLVTHAVTAVPMLPSVMGTGHDPDENVGYAAWSVAPHASYTQRLLRLESAVVEAKAFVREVARCTFQLARFWLNAVA